MIGQWICQDCGLKYGKAMTCISTWHYDNCDYCGEIKPVTEPRDYGWPELPKKEGE
jgi:hypothetical protein